MTTEEILADPEIELVVNTTQLWNHHHVTKAALEAGKHVYSEKAMDHTWEGAKENYELAKKRGLLLGAAPDCYMGSAWQTARKLVDDGYIGQPLIAYAMCMRGYGSHERGPLPEGFVRDPMMGARGTTITYDMSGYYINVPLTLWCLKRVSGYSRCSPEIESTTIPRTPTTDKRSRQRAVKMLCWEPWNSKTAFMPLW